MSNYFESECSMSARLLGLRYKKLAVPMKLGFRGGRPVLIKLEEEPYDAFLIHKGTHFALEMKSSQLYGSFPLNRVEENQVTGLKRALEDGCPAYLLINFRKVRDGRKTKEQLRAFALPFDRWDALVAACKEEGRVSIPKEWFTPPTWFVSIPRIYVPQPDGTRVLCWDLRVLLPVPQAEPPYEVAQP